MTSRTEYEQRLGDRQQALEQLRKCEDQAANFRVFFFGVGLFCVWTILGSWQLPWVLLLLPIGLFLAAFVRHERLQRKRWDVEGAIQYYQRCLARLAGDWGEVGPMGEEFLDPTHLYAGDLDVFGPGSLFQLLGSPITPLGRRTLAQRLAPGPKAPLPSSDQILQWQNSVRALRDQLDLREELAVLGPAGPSQDKAPPQQTDDALHQWLSRASGLTAPWIRLLAYALGLLGIIALGFWFVTGSLSAIFVIVLIQLVFVYRLRHSLNSIKQHSEHAVVELRRIVRVLAALEKIPGEDVELQRLQNELIHDGLKASETIHRFERWVSQFENARHNIMIAPLAFVTMINIHFACAIDLWRSRHGHRVDRWFCAVGELETLLAFSQLHYENPEYCFPKIINDSPHFVATHLAHPLLHKDTAVANDVELSEDGRMLLVSGSNMSGKSTLLRSIGLNTVLAMAGAPVCAQHLKTSCLQVAAAMRMQDSLQTGTSHFLAELQRIRLVVEQASHAKRTGSAVLFLLDEILHGTNSHDRLVGARGVIRTLLETGAIGLVTTHDLALSNMLTELDGKARDVHFCDEWIEGKMTFDYRIHEGVVPKGNALSLMRLLGLEV